MKHLRPSTGGIFSGSGITRLWRKASFLSASSSSMEKQSIRKSKIKNFVFGGKRKFFTIPILILLGLFFLPITILLFIYWLINSKISNQKLKISGSVITGLFILLFGAAYFAVFAGFSPKLKTTVQITPLPLNKNQEIAVSPQNNSLSQIEEEQTKPIASPSNNRQKVKVIQVIDGDTIKIESGQKVRLIGIDTPETVDPNRPVGCYGQEASNFTKSRLEGKSVELEKDVSDTDKYDRLLRYIWLDGVLFNETLVREGYAQVSTYPPDVKYQNKFLAAQAEARNQKKGLWSDTCQPLVNNSVTQSNPSQPVKSIVKVNCRYDCDSPDRDCSDFNTHAEAQEFFDCCGFSAAYDPMRLDRATGQGDGIACESLP